MIRPLAKLVFLLALTGCVASTSDETGEVPRDTESFAPDAPAKLRPVGRPARGVLGGYEHGRVWGWAQLLDDDSPVHVRIEVDGEPVATLLADQHRRDLVDKGLHPTGEAGFAGVIGDLPDGAEVDAFIEESGALLTNAPCVVQGEGPVSSCTEGMARAHLGGYRDGWIWGWAYIVGDGEPATVRVELDGQLLATALADRPRPDLVRKRLHRTGRAGFWLEVGEVDPSKLRLFVDGFRGERIDAPILLRR